jgi:hypothetical protein
MHLTALIQAFHHLVDLRYALMYMLPSMHYPFELLMP